MRRLVVEEPRVPEVHLGALHPSPADAGDARGEPPDREGLLRDVDVAVDGVMAHAEPGRDLGRIPEPSVDVGEDGPQLAHLGGRDLDAAGREVPLDEGARVALQPVVARVIAALEEGGRESSRGVRGVGRPPDSGGARFPSRAAAVSTPVPSGAAAHTSRMRAAISRESGQNSSVSSIVRSRAGGTQAVQVTSLVWGRTGPSHRTS